MSEAGPPVARPPNELAGELADVQAAGHAALARRESTAATQHVASRLGELLGEASDNDGLWAQLARPPSESQSLSDRDQLALRVALDVDWSRLLDELGYRPPPPSYVVRANLVKATGEVLEGGSDTNISSTRSQLRSLGDELIALSGAPSRHERRLRRTLRKGLRVAIPLVALAGGVAALVAWPGIVAGAASSLLGAGIFLTRDRATEAVENSLFEGARWLVKKTLDALRSEEDDPSRPEQVEPGDWAAWRAMNEHLGDRTLVGKLDADWAALDVSEVAEPASGHVRWYEKMDVGPGPRALKGTRKLVSRWTGALYVLWEAAVGAPWLTPELDQRCRQLSDQLRALSAEVARPDSLSPARVREGLKNAEVLSLELADQLSMAVEPHS